mgnify:CR=1 FL=1
MSGSKGEVLDVFEADLLSYLLEGQQPHPTGTHYSYEIIQEYALKAEQVICQRMSDYKFSWSQELDCCSQFHDLEFVSQNLFSLYELAKIFGDKLSQPWMVAQSCGLWAAKHKKYKFWFGDKIVESMYSWPCIFGNDNRLIVPCIYENRAVFVVSDEYWAFPSGVIDFKSQKWFSKHTSPLMRANTFEQFTASCVRNIAVWYFLIRYSPVIEYKRQNIVNSPYIYIGGAPNPSHIIWNYLGGISFAANASPELVNVEIVQSTDMLFSLQSIGLSSTDLSGRSEFDRIKYLVNCEIGRAHV